MRKKESAKKTTNYITGETHTWCSLITYSAVTSLLSTACKTDVNRFLHKYDFLCFSCIPTDIVYQHVTDSLVGHIWRS